MDYRVKWSPEASNDVEMIADYIARDSMYYSGTVVEKILDATEKLSQFPYTGRIVPELNENRIREVFVYQYRVIYQIKKERAVLVIAVIHGKRILDIQNRV